MLWNHNMDCGIASIDREHKELFHQVDKLLKNADENAAVETLAFLEKYVKSHFANEENMHRMTRYPEAAKHKNLHDAFSDTLTRLQKEYVASGYNLTMLLKINRAAAAWLQEHVLGADMDYADFYKARMCPVDRTAFDAAAWPNPQCI